MKMSALYPDYYSEVEIKWSNPLSYEEVFEQDYEAQENVYFYKILAQYSTKPPKLIYIGKAFNQLVKTRLRNRDHKLKRTILREEYKKHKFLVSLGEINFDKTNIIESSEHISSVENLLIYSHANRDFKHLINQKSIWSHNISKPYLITNKGYLKEGMEKQIAIGVFIK